MEQQGVEAHVLDGGEEAASLHKGAESGGPAASHPIEWEASDSGVSNALLSGRRSSPGLVASQDLQLQVLQLGCIIEAKDREIEILRKHLSGQAPTEAQEAAEHENRQLRAQVDQLRAELASARAAQAAAPRSSDSGGGGPRVGLPYQPPVEVEVPQQQHAAGGAASAMVLDPSAFIEKLRGLVTQVVREVCTTEAAQAEASPSKLPPTPPVAAAAAASPRPAPEQARAARDYGERQTPREASPAARVPGHVAAAGPLLAAPLDERPAAASSAHPPLVSISTATHPGLHITIAALTPSSMLPEAPATASRAAHATAVASSGQDGRSQQQPRVLELNVDGSMVFLDTEVLEQVRSSKLYDLLVRGYCDLPRDAQGKPYLSYDPRVFQVLLSFLKERYLFGELGPCDWPGIQRSLGVSKQYFERMAEHFGMLHVIQQHQLPPTAAGATGPAADAVAALKVPNMYGLLQDLQAKDAGVRTAL